MEQTGAEPRVSAIIPCYDVERWLPRCLDSVLAALPANAELIAVDDGSHDGTLAILRGRAGDEPRMKVIAAPHGGLSAARNHGLDAARGTYVFFIDADDTVASDYFTAMVDALEREAADCCICAITECEDGSEDRRERRLRGDYRFRSNAEIVRGYLPRIFGYSFDDIRAWYGGRPLFANRELAAVWRLAYRRELIESRHLRFDVEVTYFEDMVFNAHYLLGAASMTCIDRPLYHVTDRSTGMMRTVPKEGLRYCRNKLVLLRRRDALNVGAGGRLTGLYAGSCVLSALEILAYVVRGRVRCREGLRILRDYLAAPSVRDAIRGFPLSWRRPALALAVGVLRAGMSLV